ncbi:DNA-binding protein WhiA [Salisediminibacterium beveridgei]|uniref:Probable cell division protein WhiA n=1 Tax=Salisediminibacterium beveridgei TaxID=632773 RepID=A0A1D7QSI9_9BACI|nr:DNA-binding protein WhiA [Salisediminibacterium beveridgei]AOM81975.1 Putative sporulation transcription regulator whiA [Salisediminibacterium beveridgei]
MSFASVTKKELTQLDSDDCCAKAELAAIIRMNGSVHIRNMQISLDVQTENAAIARRIYTLLKKIYQVHVELLVRKKMRLKKNNVYVVRIGREARNLLENMKIVDESFSFTRDIDRELVRKDCCKRAYIRGAFLAGGSVNHPDTSSYHLEIFSFYEEHNESLLQLLDYFGIKGKLIERKKGFVLYLKEGERISEFLNVVGAHQALLKFEDVRIMKDMRNSVNRLVNCETANLNKTVGAAMRQVENIKLIRNTVGIDALPERLQEIAEKRLDHQDISLKELGEMLKGNVSKSGVNHRMRKIEEFANEIRAGKRTS